jgi:magnesium transporter
MTSGCWAKELFNLTLPDEDDFGDIEASARCFEDATGSLQIRSDFLLDKDGESRNVPVAFVLTAGHCIQPA